MASTAAHLLESPLVDPIGDLTVVLLKGTDPWNVWPRESSGRRGLLHITPLPPARRGASRLQELDRLVADRVNQSVIAVHPTLAGLELAALATLCPFNALRSARVICRTKEVRDHWERLIEAGRVEEFQDPTREPEPAVLLIEELGDRRYQEIFLAPDIDPRTISKEELALAASAARVGLHVIKQTTQG